MKVFQELKSKLNYDRDVKDNTFNFIDKMFFRELFENIKNIIVLFICALVSSCKMASDATPFGLAILAATSVLKIPLIASFLVISIITGLCLGKVTLLKFMIASILYVAIKSFIKFADTKTNNAIALIVSSIISEVIALSFNEFLLYDAFFAIYNSIMTGVFFLIFSEGFPAIYNIEKEKVHSSESLICAGVLLAVAISSFANFSILGITIRGVISVLLVMLIGWKCGPAIGSTAGLSISLTIGVMGYGSVATVATYAFCGLLSGMLAKFGKVGAIIGFVLGNMVLVFFANGSTEVLIGIKEIIVASVALFLIPPKAMIIIENLFDYNRSLAGENTVGLIEENTIYKLNAVSDVINDMAENVSNEKNISTSTDEIGSFIKTLNENTCKRCPNYEMCWKQNYHKMYEQTFNAIEILQVRGEVNKKDLEESICKNKDLFAEGLNLSYEIYKVNKDWQEKVKEQRIQMALQLKEVSKELNKVKENISTSIIATENNDDAIELEPYTLEFGIARAKKHNSTISGDSNTIIKLKDGKILVAISDGMGSGDVAARNSKKVVLNLEKFLNTGFEEDRAVKLINSYMLVGRETDNFATIDAMIFDPLVGLTEFIKIGACPTFICNKNGQVTTVDSNNLPIGILGDIEIETKTKLLKRGDIIVMVTDGVLDANFDKKEQAIIELIKAVKTTSAQRLADIMLQESIDCNFGMPKDDMTIIVARIQ